MLKSIVGMYYKNFLAAYVYFHDNSFQCVLSANVDRFFQKLNSLYVTLHCLCAVDKVRKTIAHKKRQSNAFVYLVKKQSKKETITLRRR